MSLEIPSEHQEMLAQLVGIRPHEELPALLVGKYWDAKRLADRVGLTIGPEILLLMALSGGYGLPTPKETAAPNVAKLYREGKLAFGDPVIVSKWRFGRDVPAGIQGVTGDGRVIVQMDGDSELRELEASRVTLPVQHPVEA